MACYNYYGYDRAGSHITVKATRLATDQSHGYYYQPQHAVTPASQTPVYQQTPVFQPTPSYKATPTYQPGPVSKPAPVPRPTKQHPAEPPQELIPDSYEFHSPPPVPSPEHVAKAPYEHPVSECAVDWNLAQEHELHRETDWYGGETAAEVHSPAEEATPMAVIHTKETLPLLTRPHTVSHTSKEGEGSTCCSLLFLCITILAVCFLLFILFVKLVEMVVEFRRDTPVHNDDLFTLIPDDDEYDPVSARRMVEDTTLEDMSAEGYADADADVTGHATWTGSLLTLRTPRPFLNTSDRPLL
ncbi:uncharacterized protein LOC135387351 [Ornithodoros turicata]|uniref:uncharacterized protein LOC135387351 n=1 Tax=Ornithodoros turicata TaxID=34597 RepID=UPI00313903ED